MKTNKNNLAQCGKANRCRYEFDCPYSLYPLADYLCFDNKRSNYESMREDSNYYAKKRKAKIKEGKV